MKLAALIGIMAFSGAYSFPADAYLFPPHPCGEKRGSPVSVQHVDEFSKDLMMYHTKHRDFVLLSCQNFKAVVVKGVNSSTLSNLRDKVTEMHCSNAPMTLDDLRDELKNSYASVRVEKAGFLGKNPFRCVCEHAAAGVHRKTVWKISEGETLEPTDETVSAVVECP